MERGIYGSGARGSAWLRPDSSFLVTLNCPYNYLREMHRFHGDDSSLRGMDQTSRGPRTQWCHAHPDLACFLHTLRVELYALLTSDEPSARERFEERRSKFLRASDRKPCSMEDAELFA